MKMMMIRRGEKEKEEKKGRKETTFRFDEGKKILGFFRGNLEKSSVNLVASTSVYYNYENHYYHHYHYYS